MVNKSISQNSNMKSSRRVSKSHSLPLFPFNTSDIKVLLLENINEAAIDVFREQGYQVETYSETWEGRELQEKIQDVHILGIRSKTQLTQKILEQTKNLLAIGCFCMTTNQVDLKAAAKQGIAVFNSPFSNSRSVAELVIGEIIMLARQLADRNKEMHQGVWNKVSRGCYEIRGKVLGIVGYGHVGSQVSVLAEAIGMTVYYYDIRRSIMPVGRAKAVQSLQELLEISDYVSLHARETREIIGEKELEQMKTGAYLLNNACGSLIRLPALIKVLRSRKLAGAAIDVFPTVECINDLRECPNLIMTPYIGGATEEAQRRIGIEVSQSLTKFMNDGNFTNAINFPEFDSFAKDMDSMFNGKNHCDIYTDYETITENYHRYSSSIRL